MTALPFEPPLEPEPSPELRKGRRALDGHSEITLLDPWAGNPRAARWALHCRLSPSRIPVSSSLKMTDWYVLVDALYPWGAITCHPADVGGLVATYPHQLHNARGDPALPWRAGHLCLNTERHILGRHGYDEEPSTAGDRLLWHLERALGWLEAAERGQLLARGDPYELPDFPGAISTGRRAGFTESASTFATWREITAREGLVDLRSMRPLTSAGADGGVCIAACFCDTHHRSLVTPGWGGMADHVDREWGAWILLDVCPTLPPWQAPTTWGELRRACRSAGGDIDASLQAVVPDLRDGRRHVLLIGFPIPERMGEPPCRLHWVGVLLPVLSCGAQTVRGFRPQEAGHWQRDRHVVLADDAPVEWLAAENWECEYLTSRGRLCPALTSRRVLLMGAGALGSAVAELLVRGGVTDLVVADGERLEAGNLVRHTLTLGEISRYKATALAERLTRLSPHVHARALDTPFPPDRPELQEQHEHHALTDGVRARGLVVDCTGDDTTLARLATIAWEHSTSFMSLSIGYRARRLWCFMATGGRFPHTRFAAMIAPWLNRERAEYGDLAFPREGIGCWHPVFPARADDIWLLASAAVKHLEEVMAASAAGRADEAVSLTVFEQLAAADGFAGMRKVASEADAGVEVHDGGAA